MQTVPIYEWIKAKLDEKTDSFNQLVDQRGKLETHSVDRQNLNKQIGQLNRQIKELQKLLQNHK